MKKKHLFHAIVWTETSINNQKVWNYILECLKVKQIWPSWSTFPCFLIEESDLKHSEQQTLQKDGIAIERILYPAYLDEAGNARPDNERLGILEKILESYGIRKQTTLFIVNGDEGIQNSVDKSLLAYWISHLDSRDNSLGILMRIHENPGSQEIPNTLQVSNGEEVSNSVLADLNFAQAFHLPPGSRKLSEPLRFYESIKHHREVAKRNISDGRRRLLRVTEDYLPWNHERQELHHGQFDKMFDDGDIFDHRSGAISFDPYEWMDGLNNERGKEPWSRIIHFFEKRYEEPWREDRPNYKRALATPTKFILRGEDYYANLRNESPVERLADIVKNTDKAVNICHKEILDHSSKSEWKLCLGLLDQIRNSSLQFVWFRNQLKFDDAFRASREDSGFGQFSIECDKFLNEATFIYYSTLVGRDNNESCRQALKLLRSHWIELKGRLNHAIGKIRRDIKLELKKSQSVGSIEVTIKTANLVRRWREADHPGENLLVALHAREQVQGNSLPAVGIGWGGIELPIVYRQLFRIEGLPLLSVPKVLIVNYGKYSKSARKEPEEMWPFGAEETLPSKYVLFDDNSLSGLTLQNLAEHLWMKYAASPEVIFVTRISGERRYGQMRMKDSGILDPGAIGKMVCGHLGETPFSRAWSNKEKQYKNAIGVFSLAKRRILELLYSNSSADRFDREGF